MGILNTIIMKDGAITNCAILEYPDGQRDVLLDMDHFSPKQIYTIKCRIKIFSDFELLMALVSACDKNDILIHEIKFMYLFGMRSDRSFHPGSPNYFRDIIVPILGYFRNHVQKIQIFFPHSAANTFWNIFENRDIDYPHFIYDHDAFILNADGTPHYSKACGHFSKQRDDNGKITLGKIKYYMERHTIVRPNEWNSLPNGHHIIIHDDLCDGGATFAKIADYLDENYPDNKRSLIIIHGLFTRGVDIVADRYERIYCSNSYQDVIHPKVEIIDVWGNT